MPNYRFDPLPNKVIPIKTAPAKPATAKPQLPEIGYLRLGQIVGDKDHPPIVPVGKTTWYAWIKSGKAPKPTKLGERTSAWRVEDIHALVALLARDTHAQAQ